MSALSLVALLAAATVAKAPDGLLQDARLPWPLAPPASDQRVAARLGELPADVRRAWALDRALPALAGELPVSAAELEALLGEVRAAALAPDAALAQLQEARRLYGRRELAAAEARYREVGRDSALWPQSLRERAWTLLLLGRANEALGATVSLRAPWFPSSDHAEARLLAASVLSGRCRWEEARAAVAPLAGLAVPAVDDATIAAVLDGTHRDADSPLARAAASPLVARVRRALALAGDGTKPALARRVPELRRLGLRLAAEALRAEAEEVREVKERALRVRYDALHAERRAREAGRPPVEPRPAKTEPLDDDEVAWRFDGTWWRDELGTYRYEAGDACPPEGSR